MAHSLRQGDLIWINFDPSLGHEQKGKRPALIVSKADFNKYTGFVWALPITSKIKQRADEILLPDTSAIHGAVLLSQIKTLDLRFRGFEYIGNVGDDFMDNEVLGRIGAVLGL